MVAARRAAAEQSEISAAKPALHAADFRVGSARLALRLQPNGGKAIRPPAKDIGVWLSLVEHLVRDEGVAGSNPATPTRNHLINQLVLRPSSNDGQLGGQVRGQVCTWCAMNDVASLT